MESVYNVYNRVYNRLYNIVTQNIEKLIPSINYIVESNGEKYIIPYFSYQIIIYPKNEEDKFKVFHVPALKKSDEIKGLYPPWKIVWYCLTDGTKLCVVRSDKMESEINPKHILKSLDYFKDLSLNSFHCIHIDF